MLKWAEDSLSQADGITSFLSWPRALLHDVSLECGQFILCAPVHSWLPV